MPPHPFSAMFRLFHRSPAPDKIYSSSLQTLHLGYALWYPEPHKSGELQIGDVGYIDDGSFVRVLNIDSSKPEHQVDSWTPPFEVDQPLSPDVFRRKAHDNPLEPGHYPSHGVRMTEVGGTVNV